MRLIERDADATQILRRTPATIAATFYDGSTLADPGVVTATITTATGVALVTAAPTAGTGAAPRTLDLSAIQTTDLDLWAVAWTSPDLGTVETTVEIVGAPLFTLAEARAFDKRQLADPTKFPDEVLAATRSRILDEFERICRTAFVPRFRLLQLDGDGSRGVQVWDTRVTRVRYAAMRYRGQDSYTPLTSDDLGDLFISPGGTVSWDSRGWWWPGSNNILIGYEYGYNQPPPGIRRAALILAVSQLVTTNISERTMSFSDPNGQTFRYATPGVGRSYFGLPQVDAELERYADPLIEVG